MNEPGLEPEIWFERIGPTVGWLGSYNPVTTRGLQVMLLHTLPPLLLWGLPLSILGQVGLLPVTTVSLLVVPVVVGCLLSLMRTAHRHSAARS